MDRHPDRFPGWQSMATWRQRLGTECAAGILLAAAGVAGWWWVRGTKGVEQGLETAAVAVLAAVVAAGWTWWAVRFHYRKAAATLAKQVGECRLNPSARRSWAPSGLLPGFQDLRELCTQLEALTAAFRQALADRVAQDEALESFRALMGRADTDGPMNFTVIQRGSGSSRNMVARLTPNLHWMTATPALQQFLGRRLTSLSGQSFFDIVNPQDAVALSASFQEALETGEVHNVTFRILPPGACKGPTKCPPETAQPAGPVGPARAERHVQMDVMTRYAENEAALHFRCFLVDVTERVSAERALRRRTQQLSEANTLLRRINQELERLEESYRDLYHNAPVMYFSLDASGRFVTCNDTMSRNLGYQREELVGQPYARLVAAGGRTPLPEQTHAYQQSGEFETQWAKKDGTVIDLWIRSTPVQDEEGHFVRSRSAAHDVTERKRLADELRRRRDELERANLRLRRINRELDDFTHVVSHDLKEPLRTLQAYSTFLANDYRSVLGGEGIEYLSYLDQASRRLGNLIDDLLALSRAGRVINAPIPFDPAATVAILLRDLAGLVQQKGARVRVDGRLPWAVGDPPRISQLLTNLIGNGLKYNESPQPEVVIGAVDDPAPAGPAGGPLLSSEVAGSGDGPGEGPGSNSDPDQAFVTYYVRDNGIGIDPRYFGQIFGIFRRLHLAEEYPGTGAGLAIARKIVEAHGGRIWIESQPGQGATFFFTLPAALVAGLSGFAASAPVRAQTLLPEPAEAT
jgi:PAS domain S-box-containing protein